MGWKNIEDRRAYQKINRDRLLEYQRSPAQRVYQKEYRLKKKMEAGMSKREKARIEKMKDAQKLLAQAIKLIEKTFPKEPQALYTELFHSVNQLGEDIENYKVELKQKCHTS